MSGWGRGSPAVADLALQVLPEPGHHVGDERAVEAVDPVEIHLALVVGGQGSATSLKRLKMP